VDNDDVFGYKEIDPEKGCQQDNDWKLRTTVQLIPLIGYLQVIATTFLNILNRVCHWTSKKPKNKKSQYCRSMKKITPPHGSRYDFGDPREAQQRHEEIFVNVIVGSVLTIGDQ